jgi:hypothetical protein
MPNERSDDAVIKEILDAQRLSREELASVVTAARAAGGAYDGVAWEEGDGICPEWKFPFPPKGSEGLAEFLRAAWRAKATVKIFPRGIINPDALRVVVAGLGRSA